MGDCRLFTVSSLANAMGDADPLLSAVWLMRWVTANKVCLRYIPMRRVTADTLLLAVWLTRWVMQTFYC